MRQVSVFFYKSVHIVPAPFLALTKCMICERLENAPKQCKLWSTRYFECVAEPGPGPGRTTICGNHNLSKWSIARPGGLHDSATPSTHFTTSHSCWGRTKWGAGQRLSKGVLPSNREILSHVFDIMFHSAHKTPCGLCVYIHVAINVYKPKQYRFKGTELHPFGILTRQQCQRI